LFYYLIELIKSGYVVFILSLITMHLTV